MKIKLIILNDTVSETNKDKGPIATWHSRNKSYEIDNFVSMDNDVKNSTIGHNLNSLILDDIQITSKHRITELIEFLEKAKLSFKH